MVIQAKNASLSSSNNISNEESNIADSANIKSVSLIRGEKKLGNPE